MGEMTAPVELIPLISVSRYHSHLITASECLSQQLRFSQKFPFLPLCGAFHLFHHRFAGFFLLDALSRLCHNLTSSCCKMADSGYTMGLSSPLSHDSLSEAMEFYCRSKYIWSSLRLAPAPAPEAGWQRCSKRPTSFTLLGKTTIKWHSLSLLNSGL